VSCKSLWPCCPPGQASTAHATAFLRPCIGHVATCALLLVVMYVTGTKVLADPAPRQSRDISPVLLHSGCWRRPHLPDVSSAPGIPPPSSRRCKLCSWHLSCGSDGFLEPPRGSYHWRSPTKAILGELLLVSRYQVHSTLLQVLFSAPVLGRW